MFVKFVGVKTTRLRFNMYLQYGTMVHQRSIYPWWGALGTQCTNTEGNASIFVFVYGWLTIYIGKWSSALTESFWTHTKFFPFFIGAVHTPEYPNEIHCSLQMVRGRKGFLFNIAYRIHCISHFSHHRCLNTKAKTHQWCTYHKRTIQMRSVHAASQLNKLGEKTMVYPLQDAKDRECRVSAVVGNNVTMQ